MNDRAPFPRKAPDFLTAVSFSRTFRKAAALRATMIIWLRPSQQAPAACPIAVFDLLMLLDRQKHKKFSEKKNFRSILREVSRTFDSEISSEEQGYHLFVA